MSQTELTPQLRQKLLLAQESEVTEHYIYKRLAKTTKKKHNKDILNKIAEDELGHYNIWKHLTKEEVKPRKKTITYYYWMSRIFGITFGLRLMEKGESNAQVSYEEIAKHIPQAKKVIEDEHKHEQELIDMLNEEKLDYAGSIVLGLNDALVELTGTLAGLTFALQNSRLIALAGLITGIAASFSMAASEYLSQRADENNHKALNSALYTGSAYIITVVLLILPYFLAKNHFTSLAITLLIALTIIATFNFYISVAKNYNFKKRFLEMALISMGVAAFSFGIGYVVRLLFGIDV
ncbi:rubrerythrin family protein [Candidatus Peregrinibacteria bacterium]|nr:rubrerythrin family protein [Candidatus Peregrinibacteria bacterium]